MNKITPIKKKESPFRKNQLVTVSYGDRQFVEYLFLDFTKEEIISYASNNRFGEAVESISFDDLKDLGNGVYLIKSHDFRNKEDEE